MTAGGDLDDTRDDDEAERDPGKEIDPADAGFVADPGPPAGQDDR